jgi:hypothetical protein
VTPASPVSAGSRILAALTRGAVSQLQPAMLALLGVPFVVGLAGWAISAWLLWDPLTQWLQATVFEGTGAMRWVAQWLPKDAGSAVIGVLLTVLLLIPMMFAIAITLIAVFAMPVVTRHLSQGRYRDVARNGSWSVFGSAWNAVSSLALFVVGYLVTLPLWLIPPLAFVVPWFWWSWLTGRLMRFDSLVEHAAPAERAAVIARYRREYLVLGLAVTVLNYIPPLFLVTPVLSALVFGHYSLSRLAESRPGTGRPSAAIAARR